LLIVVGLLPEFSDSSLNLTTSALLYAVGGLSPSALMK